MSYSIRTRAQYIAIRDVVVQNTIGIGIGITGSNSVMISDTIVRNIGLHERLRQAVWVTTGSLSVVIDGLSVLGRLDDVAGGDHAIICIDGGCTALPFATVVRSMPGAGRL